MNEQEKELAVQIFDYFFKKAGVNSIIIFSITKTLQFKLRLNRYSWYLFTKGITCRHEDHNIFMKYASNNTIFSLENFPRDFKSSIVLNLVSSAQQLVIPFYTMMAIVVIPKARSLEELDIKMELEI